jgi:hypothetical protein
MKTKIKMSIVRLKKELPRLLRKRWFYAGLLVILVIGVSLFRFLSAAHGAAPFGAIQFGGDHMTAISTGAYTTDGISTNIYLDGHVGSSDTTETFTPKIELRDINTAFTNGATHTGTAVQYDSNIPDKRRGTDMVYDSANKQLVVFGGFGGDTGTMVNLNDVWVLSLTKDQRSQWKKLTPSGTAPTVRRAHQLIYDSANSRVIVFGGWNGSASDGAVYALSMTPGSEAWSTLTTSGTAPTMRVQHNAIYDEVNKRMIVYGGRNDGGTSLSNTVFQLTLPVSGTPTWSQPTVSNAPSSGRELATMLYDPVNEVAWMHGGCAGSSPTNCTRQSDIWKLGLPSSGTLIWTQTNTSCGPFSSGTEGINGHAMGYDPVNQQAVIWAGKAVSYQSTVYTFNLPASGSPSCTDHSSAPIVSGSNFEGTRPHTSGIGSTKGVYDPENSRMIFMFGYDGSTYVNETWVFDNLADSGEWEYKVLAPIVYKRARDGNNMVFDSVNNMIYEFGGAGRYSAPASALHVPETWRLNTSGGLYWADAGADNAPFNREFGSFIYDEANQRGVYCFGLNHNWVLGDCWKMTINGANGRVSWSFLINADSLGNASSNRWGGMAVYDSANDRMVIFGGENNTPTILNDVQVLNLPEGGTASWTTPTVTGTPPTARQFSGAVYDPVNQRMLLFGGENGNTRNNQVWELTLPASGSFAWRQLSPSGTAPSARGRMATVYDSNGGNPRLIVFGGYDGTNNLSDVWQLTIPGSGDGTWSQLSPSGTAPTGRRSMGYVLDTVNNRMIISGGRNDSTFFSETYALNLGASPSWANLNPELTVPISVPVSGLTQNKFHWQIWATGSVTGDMPKASYGGNNDTVPADIDFRTIPPPSAISIAPNTGSTAGGTPFTITGSGFLGGSTVTIGGVAATNVFVVSSTTITGLSPPGTAGSQDIIVTNPDSETDTLSGGFTYVVSYHDSTKTLMSDFAAAGSSLTNVSASGIKIDEGVFQWLDSTPSTTGGSLAAGTYYYVVTATDFGGGETTRSFESRGVVTTGSTSSISLKWRPVPGATGYKVYRTTASGNYGSPSLIATISSANASTVLTEISYIDTAAATSAGAPPAVNTTNGELQMNRGVVPNSGLGTFAAGPSIVGTVANNAYYGAHSIQRPDGKFLLILGNNTSNTSIYDPVANSFTAGPSIVGTVFGNAYDGAHSIQRPDGKFLVILGGATSNTSVYDPVANSFTAGPAITGTASGAANSGAHSIQRPDGKFLVLLGITTSTSIYDPVANSFTAGPAVVGTSAGDLGDGAHSIQRPDGKFLVIMADTNSRTSIYDPVANSFTAGPAVVGTAGNNASYGAHSIQRPDGKFLLILGNSTSNTSIYDAGWLAGNSSENGTLGSYISEDIEANTPVKFGWITTLDDYIQTSDGTVGKIEVKVATTQAGLAGAAYANYSNGDTLPSGHRWYKIKVTFRRSISLNNRPDHPGSNVWLGESSTYGNRSFAIPSIQSFTVIYSNVAPTAPVLLSPSANSTDLPVNPDFRMYSTDSDGDSLQFRIELCSSADCSTIVRTIDQASSQTGWLSQADLTATAYSSGQEAIHKLQDPVLNTGTQYWWRAYARDVNGLNTWSSASSIYGFTIGNMVNLRITGGTNIQGGTKLGN